MFELIVRNTNSLICLQHHSKIFPEAPGWLFIFTNILAKICTILLKSSVCVCICIYYVCISNAVEKSNLLLLRLHLFNQK